MDPVAISIPWWSAIRLEIVGLNTASASAMNAGARLALAATPLGIAATVQEAGKPQTIRFSVAQCDCITAPAHIPT